MTGHYNRFVAYLKKSVPNIFTIHCVIQQLVPKNLSGQLHNSLHTVITAVNKIKAHALNDQLFQELCIENDEDFEHSVIHTEVRWLSKGNCLTRFYNLFDSVVEFFEDRNVLLGNELKEINHDIAYFSEIFAKFDDINVQLQGNDTTLNKAKSVVSASITKLTLFKPNVGRRELCKFPTLPELGHTVGLQGDDL
ncbi:hypothetical protein PR048_019881 [Dryococelus australis]|uniref:Zinc finger BED domain-containing protein 5 n=1 Tax=Dryococelus australis TaxID=614101 RepID=A0ABQ9H4P8_9NEOP|nr:hypothetical protein PR048_019881 [Dryococelus australis]